MTEQESILEKLLQLEKKIYTLTGRCNTLEKQLEATVTENVELKEIIKNLQQDLNNFHNQEKFNKIVVSMIAGTEGTAGLKRKINEYIEDIDRCIAFLSK